MRNTYIMTRLPGVIAVLALVGCAGGTGPSGGLPSSATGTAPSADNLDDEPEDDEDDDDDDDDQGSDPFEDDDDEDEDGSSTTGEPVGDTDTDGEDDRTWYRDRDEDGFGDEADTVKSSKEPEGYVAEAGDCDDTDPMRSPDATETCDQIDNDCDDVIDELAPGNEVCWNCLNLQQNDHAVILCPFTAPFAAARDDCRQFNTELLTVDDSTDLAFLRSLHPANGGVFVDRWWIGLHDQTSEGQYEWVDGSDSAVTNWASGEPNNDGNEDCVELIDGQARWNDVECDTDNVHGYICRAPHEL